MFALGVLVERNIFKGMKSGDLFPKKNIPLIMVASALVGISIFFGANVSDVMKGGGCLKVNNIINHPPTRFG